MTDNSSKEELILEAAMDEFIEHGWSGARMQSIADRAGINKALLHYYFRSKEKLYERIVYRTMNHLFSTLLKQIQDKDNFEDFLKTFIETIIDITAENPRLPMFIMQELSRGGKSVLVILSDVLSKTDPPVTRVILQTINRAVVEEKICNINPIQFVLTLLGSCLYFSMAEPIVMKIGAMNGCMEGFDRKAFLEERKKEIFTVLYRGLRKGDKE